MAKKEMSTQKRERNQNLPGKTRSPRSQRSEGSACIRPAVSLHFNYHLINIHEDRHSRGIAVCHSLSLSFPLSLSRLNLCGVFFFPFPNSWRAADPYRVCVPTRGAGCARGGRGGCGCEWDCPHCTRHPETKLSRAARSEHVCVQCGAVHSVRDVGMGAERHGAASRADARASRRARSVCSHLCALSWLYRCL